MKVVGIALFALGVVLFIILPFLDYQLSHGSLLAKGQPIIAAWTVVAGAILFTFSLMRSHPR